MTKKDHPPEQFDLFEQSPAPQRSSLQQPVDRIVIDKDSSDASPLDLIPKDAALTVLNSGIFSALDLARLLRTISEVGQIKSSASNIISKALGIPHEKSEILFACARKMALVSQKPYSLSLFGQLVLDRDAYLDHLGTLWLLHMHLASNSGLAIWSRIFDAPASSRQKPFSITDIIGPLPKIFEGRWTEYGLTVRARSEATSVLRLYKDTLFTPLKLIDQADDRSYRWIASPAPVNSLAFLAAALIYRDRYYPGASALEVSQLVDLHFAPGRVLGLPEPSIRKLLDELHAKRLVTIETRADLDQVRFKEDFTWLDAYRSLVEEGR